MSIKSIATSTATFTKRDPKHTAAALGVQQFEPS
jgi:hypothetical protein